MPSIILGLAFIVFGAVSAWDAIRISQTVRAPGVFDLVGPDRYLLALGVLLVALGFMLIRPLMRPARVHRTGPRADSGSTLHLWIFGLTSAYVCAILVAGYPVATLLFFAVGFRVLGMRDWRHSVSAAIGLTIIYYLLFVTAADMPLPKGMIARLM